MLGTRNNQGKNKWSLICWPTLIPLVKVLEFGALKYEKDNWKKGLPVTEIMESCLRHLFAFMEGEDTDTESGESHLGHAMCNLMFATYMLMFKPELDNRKKDESLRKPSHVDDKVKSGDSWSQHEHPWG